MKIQLGSKVKDVITGFTGIVMADVKYLTGCHHYAVCPDKLTKEGKMQEWEWLDSKRFIKISDKVITLKQAGEIVYVVDESGIEDDPPQM